MFVAMKLALAPHTVWACILSLPEPFNVNETVNVECNVNEAVVATSSWLV